MIKRTTEKTVSLQHQEAPTLALERPTDTDTTQPAPLPASPEDAKPNQATASPATATVPQASETPNRSSAPSFPSQKSFSESPSGDEALALSPEKLSPKKKLGLLPLLKQKLVSKLLGMRCAVVKVLDFFGIQAPQSHTAAIVGFVFALLGLIFVLFAAPVGLILAAIGFIFSLLGMDYSLGVAGLIISAIVLIAALLLTIGSITID